MIPRRIIQTGKSRSLSLKERAAVSNLRLHNADYEYLYFDDDDVERFIDVCFPQYRNTFDSFPFRIQKYDFFRYLAVYHHGGYYFDLDVFLASGLDALSNCSCVFPFEGLTFSRYLRGRGMDWQIGNYGFGATPRHPFLEAIIQNCVRAQVDPEWLRPMQNNVPWLSRAEFLVLNSTGPGLISRTLLERRDVASDLTVLFPDDVCDVNSWNRFGDIGVHLMDGSWRGRKGYVVRRLAQIWEVKRMERLIAQSRSIGPNRTYP